MSTWFRPKRYGYGATPSNWKGWLATGSFVVFTTVLVIVLKPHRDFASALAAYGTLLAITLVFAWIAWKKTDGAWRWRWGPDDTQSRK
jgi:hypothetical protein